MYPFRYVRPESIADAERILMELPDAKLLSGGMTLVPTMKQRLASPSHLVDLTAIAELRGIRELPNRTLRIGATTRHVDVARSSLVQGLLPALSCLAGGIGDPQVRNRGTIGGSVANCDPGADYPAAVLGLGATIVTNRRTIAADDFLLGMFATALDATEIIVAIEFPIPQAASYEKYRHPVSGFAAVAVFVSKHASKARVAVTGAGECAFRWIEAEERLTTRFGVEAIAGLRLGEDRVLGDIHTSPAHRAHLAGVYCRRAVRQIEGGGARA